MYKNKITQALLLGATITLAATSTFAADVPAGTKLAKKQEFVIGNGAEVESLILRRYRRCTRVQCYARFARRLSDSGWKW